MSKKSTKEYGTDLKKQYEDLQRQLNHVEAKIRKRAKLVLTDDYTEGELRNVFPKNLLLLIIKKEQEYVKKSKQTELKFDNND